MDEKLQRRVQRYGWDRAAASYDRGWRAQLEPARALLFDLARLEPGAHVLDVACGTGALALRAAERVGGAGQVVGIDISEQMIRLAQSQAAAAGTRNARFERGDAEELPFDDGSFDTVLCALGLMYLPNPERALAQFHRVLRPGGRAIAAVWGRRTACGWSGVFPIVDARVQSEVCPLFFRLGGESALERAFVAAGFERVVARRLQTLLAYPSAAAACEAAFAGGPVALAFARFPPRLQREVFDEYLSSIAQYRDGDGYRIPGEFVVVAGTRRPDRPIART